MITNANIPAIGQDAGFLGRNAGPWLLTCDPGAPDFQVPALSLPAEVPPLRLDERRSLLCQVNQHLDRVDRTQGTRYEGHVGKPSTCCVRPGPARRSTWTGNRLPCATAMAGTSSARACCWPGGLIEAGVSLVQVNWPRERGDMKADNPCWDTHSKNSQRLKTALMPPMDLAYSALLEDLSQRGLLDETLVVWIGEFGRTPKINAAGGRDHWGHVFSVALAGGGIRGGRVLGASDSIGGRPRDGRVQPQDLAATLFHCLGYGPARSTTTSWAGPSPSTAAR